MTFEELQQRQAWPLRQIDHALFTIETILTRTDGRINTITGVAKDNLVTVADEPRTIVAANLDYPEDTQRKSYRGAGQDQARRIYDPAGISLAICAYGGNTTPRVMVEDENDAAH